MSKKPKKLGNKPKDFTAQLFKILSKEPSKSFNYKQIAAILELSDTKSRNEIIRDLKILKAQDKIHETEIGKYQIISKAEYYEGVIDMTSRKNGYFVCSELEEDVFVPFINLNHALDGDKVKAYIYNRRSSRKPEAEVLEILERKKTEFVGVIDIQKNFAFVTTANAKMYTDIFIPKNKINDAEHGDVVLVNLEDWPKKADSPFGSVIKVLGKPGEHNTEIHAILAEYGLPYDFPIEVEAYANKIDTSITEEEIKKRRDMRDVLTFTIDPKDAKDFDDALSFQVLENGNFEIGVHIADVSHYLQEGTILDDEAYNRATSVYLVDRVVPMLPEKLSNGLCSLRPNEDKLTFSAVFELDANDTIVEEWFGRTVIHSDRRFAYEQAQELIENDSEDALVPVIRDLNRIAKSYRARRFEHGSVNFETAEVRFELDADGKPTGVFPRERKDAHKLIEEFMLLANKRVAEFVFNKKKDEPRNTMVYRIHEAPDPEKLQVFSSFAKKFGYQVTTDPQHVSKSFNALMENIEGKGEEHVLQSLAVRTMSKARYSTDPVGHFGLAFPFYSHFTSPIRRYPDVMTHRLLQHYLDGGTPAERAPLEIQCKHSSDREKLASDAERASIKYKQVEYMSLHEPQVFDGIITGVTEFGIFVEIGETSCEGLVRMVDLNDDFYDLDKNNYRIVGKSNGRVFTFGDKVQVKVRDTNLAKRTIDLELIGMRSGLVGKFANNRSRKREAPRGGRVIPKGKERGRRTGRR